MSRWLALATDPTAGGTTLDVLTKEGSPLAVPAPTQFIPVTTAQINPGLNPQNRNDEVRGRRANTSPISFQSAPEVTFQGRAYARLLRPIIRAALGKLGTPTGVAPAAIVSKVTPIQSGSLPALIFWLLREEQLDRATGAVISEFDLNLPIDAEGTISVTAPALFQDSQNSASPKDPSGSAAVAYPTADYKGYDETFTLRDCLAFRGSEEVEIPNLAGIKMTFNNGLINEPRSKFRPGHNIKVAEIDAVRHKLWYPNQHKIGAQNITGTIDLSSVEASAEARHLLTHAEKLIIEVAAGPLATTPASTEMLRLILSKHAVTGGGADPLVREGDQVASFEFSGYLDETSNTDLEAQITGATALT